MVYLYATNAMESPLSDTPTLFWMEFPSVFNVHGSYTTYWRGQGINNGTEAAEVVVVELRRISALMDVRLGAHRRLRPIPHALRQIYGQRWSIFMVGSIKLIGHAIPMSGAKMRLSRLLGGFWAIMYCGGAHRILDKVGLPERSIPTTNTRESILCVHHTWYSRQH